MFDILNTRTDFLSAENLPQN